MCPATGITSRDGADLSGVPLAPRRIALDGDGFVLTGEHVPRADPGGRPLFLETSWPGVFAVGEGAMAVRLVHERLP